MNLNKTKGASPHTGILKSLYSLSIDNNTFKVPVLLVACVISLAVYDPNALKYVCLSHAERSISKACVTMINVFYGE